MNARVDHIDAIVLQTEDVNAAVDFYIEAMGFAVETRDAERATLRLGEQTMVLARSAAPTPYPEPRSANDPWFQHFAIVVSDMDAAYARLARSAQIPISRGGPQRLPESTGGVVAYKFRDPEGHPLELSFVPGAEAWSAFARAHPNSLFMGVDHTALAVADLEVSLAFYRDLGFVEGPRLLNEGPEQDRLDGLDGVVLDIATLMAPGGGPHIELLHYRSPRPTAHRPIKASSLAATVTRLKIVEGAADAAWIDRDGHRMASALA